MTAPAHASPAASLVLLRDRAPGQVEVLLLQRHAGSRFAAGDHVFAGGKVEAEDLPDDVERWCRGLTARAAAARLGDGLDGRDALAYWVGAIREAFEEAGLLLAGTAAGELVTFTPDNRGRFAEFRSACQASNQAFFPMLRALGLTLATDRLTYFAHWITPEENSIRFDTRFFAAVVPPGQEAQPDGREIVASRWLTPKEAIAAWGRQEITLRTPTLKNLEIIGAAPAGAGARDIVASLHGQPVPTIRPRLLDVDGRRIAVLPGDPRWF
jgi:8-oxo-dGTP pyrophosphatase MutT (NUDIX family)